MTGLVDADPASMKLMFMNELKNAANPQASEQAMAFLDAGVVEDRAMACSIQQSLGSGANETFEFGRFEAALTHLHKSLGEALAKMA